MVFETGKPKYSEVLGFAGINLQWSARICSTWCGKCRASSTESEYVKISSSKCSRTGLAKVFSESPSVLGTVEKASFLKIYARRSGYVKNKVYSSMQLGELYQMKFFRKKKKILLHFCIARTLYMYTYLS